MFKLTRTTKTKTEAFTFQTSWDMLQWCHANKSKSGTVEISGFSTVLETAVFHQLPNVRRADDVCLSLWSRERETEAEAKRAKFVADVLSKFQGQEESLKAEAEACEQRWVEAKAKAESMSHGSDFGRDWHFEENVKPWAHKADRARRLLKILETGSYV